MKKCLTTMNKFTSEYGCIAHALVILTLLFSVSRAAVLCEESQNHMIKKYCIIHCSL